MAEIDVAKTKYALKAKLSSGQTVELTNLVISMGWSHMAEELSQRASITLANTKTEIGYLSDAMKLLTKIFIYANQQEVFQGVIWEWEYTSALKKELSFVAYNEIIKATQNKDFCYYTAGKSTQTIVSDICKKWGFDLKYEWESHTHPLVRYDNINVSEQILNTLDEAKRKLGKKYAIYMEQNTLHIKGYGKNKDVYYFHGNNIMSTNNKLSLSQLVTTVYIIGKEVKEGRPSVEHSELGETKYGAMQEYLVRGGDFSLAEAKAAAKTILSERGKPKETISIAAPDLPLLKKGDKVNIVAGNLSGFFYVEGISHNATGRTMTMEVTRKDAY